MGISEVGHIHRFHTHSCADLDMVFAHRVAIVHGVESGHLVDAHWRHFEDVCHLIHDADAAETMLALAQIEKRHDSSLFILRGVAGDDFFDELLILWRKLEGNAGIVLGGVAMLSRGSVGREVEGRCRKCIQR